MSISATKASALSGSLSISAAKLGALLCELGVRPKLRERVVERRLGGILADVDVREAVGALRGLMFEHEVAGPVEHDVNDHSLAGREDHRVDELLVLDAAAVTADELHPHAR